VKNVNLKYMTRLLDALIYHELTLNVAPMSPMYQLL